MSHGETSTALFGALTGMSAAIAEVPMLSKPAAIDTISLFIVHPSLKIAPPEGARLTPGDGRIATSTKTIGRKLTTENETLARRNSQQVRDFWAFPPF